MVRLSIYKHYPLQGCFDQVNLFIWTGQAEQLFSVTNMSWLRILFKNKLCCWLFPQCNPFFRAVPRPHWSDSVSGKRSGGSGEKLPPAVAAVKLLFQLGFPWQQLCFWKPRHRKGMTVRATLSTVISSSIHTGQTDCKCGTGQRSPCINYIFIYIDCSVYADKL